MKKILYTTIAILTVVAITLAVSCKKDEAKNADFKNVSAKLNYSGAVALDGCDYIVTIDSTAYHPDNLSAEYMSNQFNAPINITLTAKITADRFSCGMLTNSPGLPVIHIISIAKK